MSQQQCLELLAGFKPRAYCIDAGPAQVPHRLIPLVRHHHEGQLRRSRQARQGKRISPIGLDSIARSARYLRRRHHLAVIACLAQLSHHGKAARTRLVDDPKTLWLAELPQRLAQLRELSPHRSYKPRCSAPGVGYRDRH